METERREKVKQYLKEKLIDLMLEHALNDPKNRLDTNSLYTIEIGSKYGPKSKRKTLASSRITVQVTDGQLEKWSDLFEKKENA